MESLQIKITTVSVLLVGGLALGANVANGQAIFVSSRIDLTYEIQAGGLSPLTDDFVPVVDELNFSDSIFNSQTASSGDAAAHAEGNFSFASNLIEANGTTTAEASNMAQAGASLDWELTFEISSGIVFYSADTLLFGTTTSLGAGIPRTSLRLLDSSGTELFAIDENTFLPGSEFSAHGVLGPDTYMLEGKLQTSVATGDEGSSEALSSDFDLSLALQRPELPLVFSCPATDISPIGICVEAIQPKGPIYVLSGFALTHGSAEPIPYSLEEVEIDIQIDQQLELGNGPINADLAVVNSVFDEEGDHFPEELFELGSRIRTTLAFELGSLNGDEQPEDLPVELLLGGFVELLDPEGSVVATNQLQLVPEPSGMAILAGVFAVFSCGLSRSRWLDRVTQCSPMRPSDCKSAAIRCQNW